MRKSDKEVDRVLDELFNSKPYFEENRFDYNFDIDDFEEEYSQMNERDLKNDL